MDIVYTVEEENNGLIAVHKTVEGALQFLAEDEWITDDLENNSGEKFADVFGSDWREHLGTIPLENLWEFGIYIDGYELGA